MQTQEAAAAAAAVAADLVAPAPAAEQQQLDECSCLHTCLCRDRITKQFRVASLVTRVVRRKHMASLMVHPNCSSACPQYDPTRSVKDRMSAFWSQFDRTELIAWGGNHAIGSNAAFLKQQRHSDIVRIFVDQGVPRPGHGPFPTMQQFMRSIASVADQEEEEEAAADALPPSGTGELQRRSSSRFQDSGISAIDVEPAAASAAPPAAAAAAAAGSKRKDAPEEASGHDDKRGRSDTSAAAAASRPMSPRLSALLNAVGTVSPADDVIGTAMYKVINELFEHLFRGRLSSDSIRGTTFEQRIASLHTFAQAPPPAAPPAAAAAVAPVSIPRMPKELTRDGFRAYFEWRGDINALPIQPPPDMSPAAQTAFFNIAGEDLPPPAVEFAGNAEAIPRPPANLTTNGLRGYFEWRGDKCRPPLLSFSPAGVLAFFNYTGEEWTAASS